MLVDLEGEGRMFNILDGLYDLLSIFYSEALSFLIKLSVQQENKELIMQYEVLEKLVRNGSF